MIGTLQALEAIKILSRVGRVMAGKMLVADLLEGTFRHVTLRGRDPACRACGVVAAGRKRLDVVSYNYAEFTGGQVMGVEGSSGKAVGGGDGDGKEMKDDDDLNDDEVVAAHARELPPAPAAAVP